MRARNDLCRLGSLDGNRCVEILVSFVYYLLVFWIAQLALYIRDGLLLSMGLPEEGGAEPFRPPQYCRLV